MSGIHLEIYKIFNHFFSLVVTLVATDLAFHGAKEIDRFLFRIVNSVCQFLFGKKKGFGTGWFFIQFRFRFRARLPISFSQLVTMSLEPWIKPWFVCYFGGFSYVVHFLNVPDFFPPQRVAALLANNETREAWRSNWKMRLHYSCWAKRDALLPFEVEGRMLPTAAFYLTSLKLDLIFIF